MSWTAPTSDGCSPITNYVVTGYVGYWPLPATTFNSTANHADDHRVDERNDLPLPRGGDQRRRRERLLESYQPSDADGVAPSQRFASHPPNT